MGENETLTLKQLSEKTAFLVAFSTLSRYCLVSHLTDDILMALPPINKGWEYSKVSRKMLYYKVKALNDTEEPVERTARILNTIADTLEQDIQFTYDTPLKHPDKRMPVLDFKVWSNNNVIRFSFYKKEIASQFTILKRSALSDSIKRDTYFMEAVR